MFERLAVVLQSTCAHFGQTTTLEASGGMTTQTKSTMKDPRMKITTPINQIKTGTTVNLDPVDMK